MYHRKICASSVLIQKAWDRPIIYEEIPVRFSQSLFEYHNSRSFMLKAVLEKFVSLSPLNPSLQRYCLTLQQMALVQVMELSLWLIMFCYQWWRAIPRWRRAWENFPEWLLSGGLPLSPSRCCTFHFFWECIGQWIQNNGEKRKEW